MKSLYSFIIIGIVSFCLLSCEKDFDFQPEIELNVGEIKYAEGTEYDTIRVLNGPLDQYKVNIIQRNPTTGKVTVLYSSSSVFSLSNVTSYSPYSFKDYFVIRANQFPENYGVRITGVLANEVVSKDIFYTKVEPETPEVEFYFAKGGNIYKYKTGDAGSTLFYDGSDYISNISLSSDGKKIYFMSGILYPRVSYIPTSGAIVKRTVSFTTHKDVNRIKTIANTNTGYILGFRKTAFTRMYIGTSLIQSKRAGYRQDSKTFADATYNQGVYKSAVATTEYLSNRDRLQYFINGNAFTVPTSTASGGDFYNVAISPDGNTIVYSKGYYLYMVKNTSSSSVARFSSTKRLSIISLDIDFNADGVLLYEIGGRYYTYTEEGGSVLVADLSNESGTVVDITW